jgi:hypothetical protein
MIRRPSTASRPGRRHQSGAVVRPGRVGVDVVDAIAVQRSRTRDRPVGYHLGARSRTAEERDGRQSARHPGAASSFWRTLFAERSEAPEPRTRRLTHRPLDLAATLAPLRHGTTDPTIRTLGTEVLRATLSPEGADERTPAPRGRRGASRPGASADWATSTHDPLRPRSGRAPSAARVIADPRGGCPASGWAARRPPRGVVPAILSSSDHGPRGGLAPTDGHRSASRRPTDEDRCRPASAAGAFARRPWPTSTCIPGPRAPRAESHHPIGWSRCRTRSAGDSILRTPDRGSSGCPASGRTAAEVARGARDAHAPERGDYHIPNSARPRWPVSRAGATTRMPSPEPQASAPRPAPARAPWHQRAAERPRRPPRATGPSERLLASHSSVTPTAQTHAACDPVSSRDSVPLTHPARPRRRDDADPSEKSSTARRSRQSRSRTVRARRSSHWAALGRREGLWRRPCDQHGRRLAPAATTFPIRRTRGCPDDWTRRVCAGRL